MWRVKAKYSTFCIHCAGQIAKGAWITEVGDAWVHDVCPKHDYTVSAPAQRASGKESNLAETTETQAAPQYASKAQFDRLVKYIQQLVQEHNALEERLIQLEGGEEARRRHENQQPGVGRNKTNPKFQGRDAALEAEAS
jgi:hypothetical protein